MSSWTKSEVIYAWIKKAPEMLTVTEKSLESDTGGWLCWIFRFQTSFGLLWCLRVLKSLEMSNRRTYIPQMNPRQLPTSWFRIWSKCWSWSVRERVTVFDSFEWVCTGHLFCSVRSTYRRNVLELSSMLSTDLLISFVRLLNGPCSPSQLYTSIWVSM